jgi:hypothetical protein
MVYVLYGASADAVAGEKHVPTRADTIPRTSRLFENHFFVFLTLHPSFDYLIPDVAIVFMTLF